jgi:hypothetical protein
MIGPGTKPYPAFWIEVIVAGIVLLAGVAALVYGRYLTRRGNSRLGYVTVSGRARSISDVNDGRFFRRFGFWALVVLVVGGAWTFWPFSMEYHQYTHVQGTVAADVDARLLGTGVGNTRNVSQVYAVPIEHAGIFRCDDTRCGLLHKGDQIALWCMRQYQWASTPGWVCRYDRSSLG